MNTCNDICELCQKSLQKIENLTTSQVRKEMNGIFIADLKPREYFSSQSDCKVCALLYSCRLDVTNYTKEGFPKGSGSGLSKTSQCQLFASQDAAENRIDYQLRAFSFLRNYDGIKYKLMEADRKDCDAMTLAVLPKFFTREPNYRRIFKAHLWRYGHLFYNRSSDTNQERFRARVIPRHFNMQIARYWLGYCKKNHTTCCVQVNISKLVFIDCEKHIIDHGPQNVPYITLSYVWNPNRLKDEHQGSVPRPLPLQVPKGIEDAIQVTRGLGFRYLWVDKYCIPQDGSDEMYEQLRSMDQIYKGSEITIVAAVENEEFGLAGVGTTRRNPQPNAILRNVSLISTMSHPHQTIKNSQWMTRGWTFQEAILSRRLLVFTIDQVYFECNAMHCCESVDAPLDLLHMKNKEAFLSFMRTGLFTGRDEGVSDSVFGVPFGTFNDHRKDWSYYIRKYLILVTNYTSRSLGRDSDSLNAFAGIMRQFENLNYPIHQLLGLPYLNPSVFPNQSVHINCLIATLCWRHIDCWPGGQMIRQRDQFPSWTWAGWAGAVSWTDLFTYGEMDLESLVDNLQYELEDGTIVALQDERLHFHNGYTNAHCALRFSASLVPPNMITFLTNLNRNTSWYICSFRLELHISEFAGDQDKFVESLEKGWVECVFVAKGNYNSYFLFIEPLKNGARRIGAGEAVWSEDDNHRRFANEVPSQAWARRDIRLI